MVAKFTGAAKPFKILIRYNYNADLIVFDSSTAISWITDVDDDFPKVLSSPQVLESLNRLVKFIDSFNNRFDLMLSAERIILFYPFHGGPLMCPLYSAFLLI
jgi:hypothetical protein